MTKRLAPIFLCLALALVPAGCGSDDEDSGDGGTKTSEQPAGGSGGGGGGTVTVTMKNVQNRPMAVTVKKGGTIEWKNADSFAHTVTKQTGPGPSFDSGDIDGGGTFKQEFTTAGTIKYHCEIHPNQTGTITVR